ncbi:uncharacterized protein K460DRAFT_395171, partial [Cucurbitaria berberidis CBS 394.84]
MPIRPGDLMAAAPGQKMASDGRRMRVLWADGDGNGKPSSSLIERCQTTRLGHPTWKIFCGNVANSITRGKNGPPYYVYLDNRAAYATGRDDKDKKNMSLVVSAAEHITPKGNTGSLHPSRLNGTRESPHVTFSSHPKSMPGDLATWLGMFNPKRILKEASPIDDPALLDPTSKKKRKFIQPFDLSSPSASPGTPELKRSKVEGGMDKLTPKSSTTEGRE